MDRAYESTLECAFNPLGETVPLFAIGNYESLDRQAIDISYLPDHKPAAEKYAVATQLAAPFVAEWFGNSRGRGAVKAEVLELADPEAAPYESGSMLLTPLNIDSKMAQLEAVHQLTHATFYSPRPWINEGLAHFAQAEYRERDAGRDAALDFMGLHRNAVADAEKTLAETGRQNPDADGAGVTTADAVLQKRDSLIDTSIEEFYRSKAMYVWWMLRDMIGEDALKRALATYRSDGDTAPDYMQHLIEKQANRDLGWFFDDWVYRNAGLPDLKVASAYSRKMVGNNYVVTVTIENRGGAGADVPVTLTMVEGQVVKRLEVRANSRAVIRLEAASAPMEVKVNDGSVPENDISNNLYKIEMPEKPN
jgi:hypothetical protein